MKKILLFCTFIVGVSLLSEAQVLLDRDTTTATVSTIKSEIEFGDDYYDVVSLWIQCPEGMVWSPILEDCVWYLDLPPTDIFCPICGPFCVCFDDGGSPPCLWCGGFDPCCHWCNIGVCWWCCGLDPLCPLCGNNPICSWCNDSGDWCPVCNPGGGEPPPPNHTVTVSANPASGGTVSGGGIFPSGSQATITATANLGYEFVTWTGDATVSRPSHTFTVSNNMSFIANFIPCIDGMTGNSVPFGNMVFAPPNPARPRGATFGAGVRTDRQGNPRNHWGIDLGAPVGTPIRAAQSGTVARVVYEQPNRIGDSRNYPPGYTGDRDCAGNRILINIGNGRQAVYWHLQAGNAIAVNPRTGVPFRAGDQVFAGEVIGYVGLTGNANVFNVPHLHFGVRNLNTGAWVDPFNYLNATQVISGNNFSILVDCAD
ncbi:MAG: peptidoglycan DD-metalloendopeptidase family protein [Bacteroidales bacterium]|nr:peptidoglycan DD-metalloendopeptidase family protein [Bacteroidales bacterium]